MSFNSIVTQLQRCLGSASIFTAHGTAQVPIADWKSYTLGYTPIALIEVNPQMRSVRESFGGGKLRTWVIPLTVSAQWRDADNGPAPLAAAWEGVIAQIDKYPFLGLGGGAGIRDANIDSANLQPVMEDVGSIKYAHVRLNLTVSEEVDVTEEE